MHLTLLSRRSDLAVLQARLVARALEAHDAAIHVTLETRTTEGDRDRATPLSAAPDKGLFTADLSDALASGHADLVVHSWKDLPIEARTDTIVAGTLARADPRDVLLVRRDCIVRRPDVLSVLTSSPRRAWQADRSLSPLLPWPVGRVLATPVRGNIPTRLRKLIEGDADALVVAKAALDRLLSADGDAAVAAAMRDHLAQCAWMILPVRHFPTAPAQGALAIEVARNRVATIDLIKAISHEPTFTAVGLEREILRGYGGGCHASLGATVLPRDYGLLRSVRGRLADGTEIEEWALDRATGPGGSATGAEPSPAASTPGGRFDVRPWPLPHERKATTRRPLAVTVPASAGGIWVTRTEALPDSYTPSADQLVWTAGGRTWRKLAARGIWVHGSTEGLGDTESPDVDHLANRKVDWLRLTHANADIPGALATYVTEPVLPDDLTARTHFFWTSGAAFRRVLEAAPSIRSAFHASGPGRTARTLRDVLGPDGRVSIWLDYDQWLESLTQ
jgi:hydroxymethylbilane synthase